MSFTEILSVLDNHKQQIKQTSGYLDESLRRALADAFVMAKRTISNSASISFVMYFDALSKICSAQFDKTYSKYAITFDLKHEDKSICYAIFKTVYPELSDQDATEKYDKILEECVNEKSGEIVFSRNKFESRFVFKWLQSMRPERKIALVAAFHNTKIVEQFNLKLLDTCSSELLELATHTTMAAAFVVCIVNKDGILSDRELARICAFHTSAIMHLAAPVSSILAKSGLTGLTGDDLSKLDKAVKSRSMKNAQSKRKTVSAEIRAEWREYALENWSTLTKPHNQVGDMAEQIKKNLPSAKVFESVTIANNLNNIKKQASASR